MVMTVPQDAGEVGSSRPLPSPASTQAPAMVPVWDRSIRVFHWSLVGLFVVCYFTGEDLDTIHITAGYVIVVLLGLRVVSGFIGPSHALFSDFVRSPRAVLSYVNLVRQHRAPRYLGHNPAGGAMAIALMVAVAGICLTGHLMTTTAFWGSDMMEDLHKLLVNGTLGLIGLHLLGNLFSSRENHENLTMSMINGLKRKQ